MTNVINRTKNDTDITNRSRTGTSITWDEATFTWDDSKPSTWNVVKTPINKRSKNSAITVTNRTKT